MNNWSCVKTERGASLPTPPLSLVSGPSASGSHLPNPVRCCCLLPFSSSSSARRCRCTNKWSKRFFHYQGPGPTNLGGPKTPLMMNFVFGLKMREDLFLKLRASAVVPGSASASGNEKWCPSKMQNANLDEIATPHVLFPSLTFGCPLKWSIIFWRHEHQAVISHTHPVHL